MSTAFLDEAGIMNMLPRPNVATQAPTLAPTQAPSQAPSQAPTLAPTQAPTRTPTLAPTRAPISPQLQTAANLTKTPAPTTKTYIVPVATPGPITSTPAPLQTYQGPQDDLLFDPDPLEGDAAAGAGYALPGTAMISGPTSTMYQTNSTSAPSNAVGTVTLPPSQISGVKGSEGGVTSATIDLADEDSDMTGEAQGNTRSIWTFVVIIALLIALILALFAFYGMPGSSGGGGGGGSGMGGDPFGGLSTGGISSGLGGSGLGGLGGRY